MVMKRKSIVSYLFWACFFFAIDRITKIWALASLSTSDTYRVVKGWQFHVIWNRGISWGTFATIDDPLYYLLITAIIVLIGLFFFYAIREYRRNVDIIFEIMVIMGAVANLYDRFVYGAVVDFIDLYVGTWHWPTFNIADALIVIGVFGIVMRSLRDEHSKSNL
jgi:signal peptidase II